MYSYKIDVTMEQGTCRENLTIMEFNLIIVILSAYKDNAYGRGFLYDGLYIFLISDLR